MQKRLLTRLAILLLIIIAAYVSMRLFNKSFPQLIPSRLKQLLSYAPSLKRKEKSSRFEEALRGTLNKLEVAEQDITESLLQKDSLKHIQARIPRGRPIEWIVWDIAQSANATSYTLTDCSYNDRKAACTFDFQSSEPEKPRIRLVLRYADRFFSNSAKLAILIEDFEFQADQTTINILSFPKPLTIALAPSLAKSAWTAQAADQYKKEVVVQLMLEPLVRANTPDGAQMIMVHYPAEKIKSIISAAVESIPNFAGFNNVLGSRALEDSRVTEIVLREIKKRHGYFVETNTARSSVAPALARTIELAYARVGAHIPDNANARDIKDHLSHFCVVAHKKGEVLVAAKASAGLVEALNDMHDVFRQNGIRLVYVSEIVDKAKS
jgi:polysaccharide deacetylase 2 family uncharacterized protein YibQ